MSLPRVLLGFALARAVRVGTEALVSDPQAVRRRVTVEPAWRVPVDGRAPRLSPQQTIDVARRGRWKRVDPRLPNDGWRRGWAVVGLTGWLGAVAGAAFVGWKRGVGPLRGVGELREFGSAFRDIGGFDDADLAVDDREHWIG